VQKQLAEAISIIAKYDFPLQWNNLLPQLVNKLNTDDVSILKGVMITANSIMKRFRYTYKSDDLYAVLTECLQAFQVPLLETYKRNTIKIENLAVNKPQLQIAIETQRLMTRIFFSLNWQDLPEYFEDHITEWMGFFSQFLNYKNPILIDQNEETEPGPIESLQTAVIENINLYATKYEEEFNPFLPAFTQAIWTLLLEVGPQQKYDTLTASALKFLTTVCSKPMNVGLFSETVLKDIVQHIVIRNLMASEQDEELFEDNPTDYIRKDFEGGDQDTRRRSAMELIRALLKFFSDSLTRLCIDHIGAMLEQYRVNLDWKVKDAALHLVLAVSVMSASANLGAGTLNPLVNVLDLIKFHIIPDLLDSNINAMPVVKADAIKLICFFRTHLQTEFILILIPDVIRHLSSKYVVVQTYAAICLERFLALKLKDNNGGNLARITKLDLLPHIQPLFTGLFNVLDNPDLPENDYVMKCIMKSMSIVSVDILPMVGPVLAKLTTALARVCAKPMNPYFNHYLFESIAILVRSICIDSPSEIALPACNQFEILLFPPFQSVLTQDVTEFIPYVFQVLSLLLSARPPKSGLSDAYKSLFPPLLSPLLWKQRGYVPALSDLFKAYIITGMTDIIEGKHLEAVLGIFQELLSVKVHEHFAFKLLNMLYLFNPIETLTSYLPIIFDLQLRRMKFQMKDNRTPKYCRLFLHSMLLFVVAYSPTTLYMLFERIDPGLLPELINHVWIPNKDACTLLDSIEIQEMLVGATKLLCDSPISQSPDLWISVLKATLPLLEAKGMQKIDLDDDFLDDEADQSREFDTKFSKLLYAQTPDPLVPIEVVQSKQFFATSLGSLCRSRPGQYTPLIQKALLTEEAVAFSNFLQSCGVVLS
jgi:exportin-2 (importin alpha re-exporter)